MFPAVSSVFPARFVANAPVPIAVKPATAAVPWTAELAL